MHKSFQESVLVIEANPAINTALCEILELNGYRVYSAGSGEDALPMLKQHRLDVVLCDTTISQMDGYALLGCARADERLRTLPFIFLTARSSSEDQQLARSIGIEDYLVKPVGPEDLLLAVENALRRSRDLAVEIQYHMDALRTQIVRTLQHEFRTPLTFILGYAEYLAGLSSDQIDLETLHISSNAILEGGLRLQNLVEKFLLLADLQFRHKLPGKAERLNAYLILENAAKAMAQEATAASMEIVLPSWESAVEVLGDVRYLYKAVIHLLENAIHYRQPSSKFIWLSVQTFENNVGLVVKDESRGVPEEILAGLSQPFVQAAREERTVPGAGLSLTLVQHIVRLHSGHLEVESTEGKGSTFTLWLPKPIAGTEEVEDS